MEDMTDDIDYSVQMLAGRLDPGSRVPLYEQIAQAFGEDIRRGTLAPGALFPPEPELAQRLGISRQTVHQAMTDLARRGLVRRRRGVGTFVAEPFVEQPLDRLYSFLRSLTEQGHHPSSRLLGYRLMVDPEVSQRLTGRSEGLIVEITRMRLVDGEPFALETILLPESLGEHLPLDRLASETLYDLLREVHEITVTHAEETLQPVSLEATDAVFLGLSEGDPAFLVERAGYVGDRLVEVRRSLIRGDRYRFRVRLTGPALELPDERLAES
jgi:GntR family transcriptional regulator